MCVTISAMPTIALKQSSQAPRAVSAALDASIVDKDAPSHSIAEQVVCTRTTEQSPEDPPLGACVIPCYPAPKLLVLTSDVKLIDVSLLRYRICPLLAAKSLLCEELLCESQQTEQPMSDFETEIKVILGGSRVPALSQSDKVFIILESYCIITTHTI